MSASATTSTPKPGTSWVWTYFKTSERNDGKAYNICHANKSDGSTVCLKELAVDRSGSTKSMINHLQRKHGMIKPNLQNMGASIPVTPQQTEDFDSPLPKSKPRSRTKANITGRLNPSNLRAATAKFLVSSGVSYACLDDQAFVSLLEVCNPGTKKMLTTPDEMRAHVLHRFEVGKLALSQQLQDIDSFISLTCDAWTSPAGHPMLEVVAHWIDNEWSPQSSVIAFVRLDDPHTEENIATTVHNVLTAYKIGNKILCITGDTASQTALSGITFNKLLPRFHPNYNLVGCMTHVIDLAGKVILAEFQDDSETCIKTEPIVTSISVNPNDNNAPRTIIGRLHGLAGRFKDSAEAKEKFLETASLVFEGDALDVFFGNTAAWNSTYHLLDRAVKLRDAINVFCMQDEESSKFQITPMEWEKIQHLLKFLKPLERLTKDLTSTDHCTMMNTVPTFEWLVKRTKKVLTDHANPELLASALQMQLILDDYQRQALQKPVYLCSPVLDPRIKLTSVPDETHSPQGTIVEDVKEIFKDHAKPFDQHLHVALHDLNGGEAADSSDDDNGPRFLKRRKKFTGFDGEIASYFNGELEDEACDPLEYWKSKSQLFPSLSRMARSYLAAQASSSSHSIEGSNRRNALGVLEQELPITDVEAFTCLKSWIGREGVSM